MERWTNVRQEGIHLATIRVYHEARNKSGTKPRIVLFLPSATRSQTTPQWPVFNANAAVLTEGDEDSQVDMYDLEMINAAVDNQIVVAEIAKAPPPGSSSNKIPWNPRTRTTMATGKVVHSCNLKPVLSSAYRRQAAERAKMYNAPRASIKMIEQAGITGGRGGINRLTSGVGAGAPNAFGDLVVSFYLLFRYDKSRLTRYIDFRSRNRNLPRDNSSGWLVLPRTSCSICYSRFLEISRDGPLNPSESARSNPNHISKKCSTRLARYIVMGSLLDCGS